MLKRQALGHLRNHCNKQVPSQPATTTHIKDDFEFKAAAVCDENAIHKERLSNKAKENLTDMDEFEIFCDAVPAVRANQQVHHDPSKCTAKPLGPKTDSPMVLDMSIDTSKCQSDTLQSDITDDDLVNIDDDEDDDEVDDHMDLAKQRKREALERDNILMNCEEYGLDILKHLREAETKSRANPAYIKQQKDITPSMRSILVDWLVEVSEEYNLHTETLYLAVNYTDRFLSKMSVLRGKLQLLGTASMYIARQVFFGWFL
jgi:hypothetical protein